MVESRSSGQPIGGVVWEGMGRDGGRSDRIRKHGVGRHGIGKHRIGSSWAAWDLNSRRWSEQQVRIVSGRSKLSPEAAPRCGCIHAAHWPSPLALQLQPPLAGRAWWSTPWRRRIARALSARQRDRLVSGDETESCGDEVGLRVRRGSGQVYGGGRVKGWRGVAVDFVGHAV